MEPYAHVAKSIFGSEKQALLNAIEHELEELERGIVRYSVKYRRDFPSFERALKAGKEFDSHAYETEMDFMEWETLEARKSKVIDALRRLA